MTTIVEEIGRPPRKRGTDGRWQRADGGNWDWWYALPDDDRRYIQRHHMVANGIEPDVVADERHGSVDEWADEWVGAIRAVRRHHVSKMDPLDDAWDLLEPEEDVSASGDAAGDMTLEAMVHVVARSELSDTEVAALVRNVRVAQALRGEVDGCDDAQVAAAAGRWEHKASAPRVPAMVGQKELAALMGVQAGTIRVWKNRGKLPPPTEVISGTPCWSRVAITTWLDECRAAV